MKIFLITIAFVVSALPGFTQDLAVGVTGSTTLQGWENPVTLLRQQSVQDAVLAIAERPRNRAEIEAMLNDEPYGVDALVKAWVLDERDGKFFINFNLVTEEDGPVLKKIRDHHGRILANEVVKRWDTISSVLDAYDLETVPKDVLAYILVGAFSLDWDGLGKSQYGAGICRYGRTFSGSPRRYSRSHDDEGLAPYFCGCEYGTYFGGGGYIADPYRKPEPLKGFFPVVWTLDNNPDELVGRENREVNNH